MKGDVLASGRMIVTGSVAPPGEGDEPCRWGDVGCKIGEGLQGAGEKFFGWMVDRTVDGITSMLEVMSLAWFNWPSPTLATRPEIWDETGLSPTLLKMHDALTVPIYLVACASFLFAVIRMVWTMRAQELQTVLRMFVILLSSTVTAAVVVQALLEVGDAFAPWVVQTAAGEEYNSTAFQTLVIGFTAGNNMPLTLIVVTLIMALFMILGTIAQVAFMILRAPLILTMMVFLPLVAAGTATEEGMQRFKKLVGFLLAAVLYKPAAAVIYATGILLMRTSDEAEGVEQLLNLLYGTIVIVLAALALPALIKFFMPSAAVGSSNVFSGGAVGLAGGAVVVGGAMLAAGGAGAGASGAAGGAARGAAGGAAPPPGGQPHSFPALGPGGGGGPSNGGGSAGGGGSSPPPGGGASFAGGGGQSEGGASPSPSGSAPPVGGGGSGGSSAGPAPTSQDMSADSGGEGSAPHGAAPVAEGFGSSSGSIRSPGASGDSGSYVSASEMSTADAMNGSLRSGGGGTSAGVASKDTHFVPAPTGGHFARAGRGSALPSGAPSATPQTPPLVTSEGVVMGAQPGTAISGGTRGMGGRRMGARVLGESGVRGWNGVTSGAGVNSQEAEGAPAVPTR